jgi:hypothetical protein
VHQLKKQIIHTPKKRVVMCNGDETVLILKYLWKWSELEISKFQQMDHKTEPKDPMKNKKKVKLWSMVHITNVHNRFVGSFWWCGIITFVQSWRATSFVSVQWHLMAHRLCFITWLEQAGYEKKPHHSHTAWLFPGTGLCSRWLHSPTNFNNKYPQFIIGGY